MGASLKVHAIGGGKPQVDVCLKNGLPADHEKGTYVKFQMSGNVTTYDWLGVPKTSKENLKSGWYGRGQERCKKFDKGARVFIYVYAGPDKTGTNFHPLHSYLYEILNSAPYTRTAH